MAVFWEPGWKSCKATPAPPTHTLPTARAAEAMWSLLLLVPTGEKRGGVRAKNSAVNDTRNSNEPVSQAGPAAGPRGPSAPRLTAASVLKGGAVQGPSVRHRHRARLGVPRKASRPHGCPA